MLKQIVLVGIGGGTGSIFRYLTSVFTVRYYSNVFPLATFIANLIGCLLIGLFIGYIDRNHTLSPDYRFLLVTGFCGGYTTFSSFALENFNLFHSQNYFTLASYILISILMGYLAVALGMYLSKTLTF
ncbi:MAG: fluoride efflux transporter CrcB [Chitinophagales bacterium]